MVCAAVLLTGAAPDVAHAVVTDPVTCQKLDPYTGECLITATAPGAEPARAAADDGGDDATATAPGCYDNRERKVPCRTAAGYWSAERRCRIAPVQPSPPLDDPIWAGVGPGGAFYTCSLDDPIGDAITDYTFWAAAPPPAAGATVDPAALAEQAVTAMGLQAIDIGIAPEATDGSVGLVGLPVWMWVEEAAATTVGPLTEAASAGGVTVTATATVDRIEWTMGDGTTVTCTGPGTPYADTHGDQDSPDCGHRYQQASSGLPEDAYPISATSYWTVDWAGGGAAGRIALDFTAGTQIQVGELQVLVTR